MGHLRSAHVTPIDCDPGMTSAHGTGMTRATTRRRVGRGRGPAMLWDTDVAGQEGDAHGKRIGGEGALAKEKEDEDKKGRMTNVLEGNVMLNEVHA